MTQGRTSRTGQAARGTPSSPASPRRPFPRAAVEPGPCCSDGRGARTAHSTSLLHSLWSNQQRTRETPPMTSATSDVAPLLSAGLPAPAAKWTGLAKYSFVGGHNDPDQVPVDALIEAINAVLRRE